MFEERNLLVEELNAMAIPDMVMDRKEKVPLSTMRQRALELARNLPVFPRDIFKISEYTNEKYRKVWLCYVSGSNPQYGEKVKMLSNCFAVAEIEGEFKIVSKYFTDYDTNLWRKGGGDADLEDFYSVGEFVATERYLSPLNDEWSVEEYNKDA